MLDLFENSSSPPQPRPGADGRPALPAKRACPGHLLSPAEVAIVHESSMAILSRSGICLYDAEARALCRHHGLKTDGLIVRFDEADILKAVSLVPPSFTVRARNPARSVVIGQGPSKFAPGYGAPFVAEPHGVLRPATIADYDNLTRLVQALPNQDLSGHLLVQPNDVPASSAHLHMIRSALLHSDKPFMGSAAGKIGAEQTMAMAAILFGEDQAAMAEQPVTMALVDSLSPLQYSTDMTQAIMAYARFRQPIILAALVMAGATGPITLAGALAQQNAELLAGITLTQLVSPGTPVVYGTASTIMDMRAGTLAVGSPELALLSAASIQLAQSYGIPSRGAGALTDAHLPDAQAGMESMMGLLAATQTGSDFVLHAAGILSSFLALSYEKLVLDDDLCGMARRLQRGLLVTAEELALEEIEAVGPGGTFLETEHTTAHCRTAFWHPSLMNREDNGGWIQQGSPNALERAGRRWRALLAAHQDPPLDQIIRRQLDEYVAEHDGVAA